jgi:predicted TIM-barrel enzyme
MIIKPQNLTGPKPHLIAMVHVLSTNALENTVYNDRFGINTYSTSDLETLQNARIRMKQLHAEVVAEHQIDCLAESKSSIFVLRADKMAPIESELSQIPFIKDLIDRAIAEVEVYTRNGIQVIEIENAGAPYFIGSDVPMEELAILHLVTKAVRLKFPNLMMGVHVLAGDELESLPIAMASDAYFIRSETSVFSGFRPEGRMLNRGNLAKFYYLRNFLNAYCGIEDPQERRYPQIWSDLQKKHTVFETELRDLHIWLDNVLFVKLEGIILTGVATGKDIAQDELIMARQAIDQLQESAQKYFGEPIQIPLITGSGLDVPTYKKYADFIITGTQLKQNKYWENPVSEEHVKELVAKFE